MTLLTYLIFRLFVGLFAVFPFVLMYAFADMFYGLAFYVIKYRRKVVVANLEKAFPEKPPSEIQHIAREYYKHLANLMAESLKGLTMSKKSIHKRHKIINPELLNEYYDKNISVIGVSGHYGNWEWGTMSGGWQVKHTAVGLYKPLSNCRIDEFMKRTRAKCGTQMASIKNTYEAFQMDRPAPCIFLMIADQSPTNLDKAYWIDFLGIDTAFLHGPEKYAKLYNYPVLYIDIKPIKRGFYELELIPICQNPSELKDGELTGMFAAMLEKRIRERPRYWIWSHRRWKHSRAPKAESVNPSS
jgi:Kdo2-lipid IVA lauroyltransferase/acyltransferase